MKKPVAQPSIPCPRCSSTFTSRTRDENRDIKNSVNPDFLEASQTALGGVMLLSLIAAPFTAGASLTITAAAAVANAPLSAIDKLSGSRSRKLTREEIEEELRWLYSCRMCSQQWYIDEYEKMKQALTGAQLQAASHSDSSELTFQRQPRVEPIRMTSLDDEFRASVLAELRSGTKIAAIKRYRLATGAGLRDSLRAVETLARENGITATTNVSASSRTGTLLFVGIAIAIAIAIALSATHR